jgi:ATP-dependent Clp protease ATP-binding subunit ClpA
MLGTSVCTTPIPLSLNMPIRSNSSESNAGLSSKLAAGGVATSRGSIGADVEAKKGRQMQSPDEAIAQQKSLMEEAIHKPLDNVGEVCVDVGDILSAVSVQVGVPLGQLHGGADWFQYLHDALSSQVVGQDSTVRCVPLF